jgi:uncharacterized membrane protein YeaQ/YmgE (transglycosylase-associated protein family)
LTLPLLLGWIGALVGTCICAAIGLHSSQYWPVFGGFIEKSLAEPWSPARESLIPEHLLAFGLLGGILCGMAGACFGLFIGLLSGTVSK